MVGHLSCASLSPWHIMWKWLSSMHTVSCICIHCNLTFTMENILPRDLFVAKSNGPRSLFVLLDWSATRGPFSFPKCFSYLWDALSAGSAWLAFPHSSFPPMPPKQLLSVGAPHFHPIPCPLACLSWALLSFSVPWPVISALIHDPVFGLDQQTCKNAIVWIILILGPRP